MMANINCQTFFYDKMMAFTLTGDQLKDHSFPRCHPNGKPGLARIYPPVSPEKSLWFPDMPEPRNCIRCGTCYQVDKYGFSVEPETCIYHPHFLVHFTEGWTHPCCGRSENTVGCQFADKHTSSLIDLDDLRGYVKSIPREIPEKRVFALDCETCVTTQGVEAIKVSLVNECGKVAYETLIEPQNPIVSYDSKYHVIPGSAMRNNAVSTLADAQSHLVSFISVDTILIGHDMEKNLRAVRFIHSHVVDTTFVFPHSEPNVKRTLSSLCLEYLGVTLQADGNRSSENATNCMALMWCMAKKEGFYC